ncbi:MAG TPA: MBL fold metallo-hydrolase [Burkholderiales bacterium]|nr:MBL fold metallo-hydrolase [Burkholderiales bacterium]
MSARLAAVSGLGAKGPACFLIDTGHARLLLDLGYGPQPGLWPDVSTVGAVDALLLSHGHRDHAGALDLLPKVGNPRVYASDIVRRLLPRGVDASPLPLHGTAQVCDVRVTTGRNGHAPGGVWLHLAVGDGVLYMGDYSVESAVYAFDPPPAAATVILDGSYGDYDTPLAQVTPEFDALFDGGPVLLPVPPGGRAADIALHVGWRGGALPHVDPAVRQALQQLADGAAACLRSEARADIARIARDAPDIATAEGVMLAGAADAASGSAADLVARWEKDDAPAIVFTGYLPAGTPAERLTRSRRASYLRWNVHPRLSDNARLVRETRARTVLPAFGDARYRDAWRAAFAPARVVVEDTVAP